MKAYFINKDTISKLCCSPSCVLLLEKGKLIFTDYLSSRHVVVEGKQYYLTMLYQMLSNSSVDKQSLIRLLSMANGNGMKLVDELVEKGLVY